MHERKKERRRLPNQHLFRYAGRFIKNRISICHIGPYARNSFYAGFMSVSDDESQFGFSQITGNDWTSFLNECRHFAGNFFDEQEYHIFQFHLN